MMEHFNVNGIWEDDTITVSNQQYKTDDDEAYTIEADWSAASYWYSMAALSKEVDLKIMGLSETSLQGDSIVKDLYAMFGVKTKFIEGGVYLTKTKLCHIHHHPIMLRPQHDNQDDLYILQLACFQHQHLYSP